MKKAHTRMRTLATMTFGGAPMDTLLKKASDAGVTVTDFPKSSMRSNGFPRERVTQKLALVWTTVAEYGFPDGAEYLQVLSKAVASGQECPCETAVVFAPLYMLHRWKHSLLFVSNCIPGMNAGQRDVFLIDQPVHIPRLHFKDISRVPFLEPDDRIVLLAA